MITMQIELPEDLAKRLSDEAEERGVLPGELGGLIVAAWMRSRGDGLEEVDAFRDQ